MATNPLNCRWILSTRGLLRGTPEIEFEEARTDKNAWAEGFLSGPRSLR